MPSDQEIRNELRSWILGKAKDGEHAELTDRTPVFEERYLRSIHLPELLLLLEKMTGSPVDVEDMRPGDFRDIDTIMLRFCTGRRER